MNLNKRVINVVLSFLIFITIATMTVVAEGDAITGTELYGGTEVNRTENYTIDLGASTVYTDINKSDLNSDQLYENEYIIAEVVKKTSKDILAQTGTTNEYTGEYVGLSDCLFTFEKAGENNGQYRIYAYTQNNTKVYLNLNGTSAQAPCQTTEATITVSESTISSSFYFKNIALEKTLYFYYSGNNNYFDRIGLNTSGYENNTSLYLYKRSSEGNEYIRINSLSEVINGEEYLIVAKKDNGTLYALRPNTGSYQAQVAKITQKYKSPETILAFYEKESATPKTSASLTIGDVTYNFQIVDSTPKPANAISLPKTVNVTANESITLKNTAGLFDDALLNVVDSNIASVSVSGSYNTADTRIDVKGTKVYASDCMYTFDINPDGTYTVSSVTSDGQKVYLNITNSAPQTSECSTPISVHHIAGTTKYRFTDVEDNKQLYFNSYLNFNGQDPNGPFATEMFLYKRVEGSGSNEIPGYAKASSIENGEKYLIVVPYKKDGSVNNYVLYPSSTNDNNSRNSHVGTVTNDYIEGVTEFRVVGIKPGKTEVKYGDKTVLNINVLSEPAVVITTNDYSCGSNVVRKLSISEKLSYSVTLDDRLKDATNICWTVSNSSILSVAYNGGIANISVGDMIDTSIREEWIKVTYDLNDESFEYTLPIRVLPTVNPNSSKFNMYIMQTDNTTPYYSLNCAKTPGSTDYLIEAVSGEVIYISYEPGYQCIDFFGAPNDGYALSYMGDRGSAASAGNYDKINSPNPKECDFYKINAGATQVTRFGTEKVEEMLTDAINKKCIGGLGYNSSGNNISFAIAFASDRLPTIEMSPYKIVTKNEQKNIAEGDYAHVGDTVIFKVEVKAYSSDHDLEFISGGDTGLSTLLAGAYFSNENGEKIKDNNGVDIENKISVVSDLNQNPTNDSTYTYYVAYEIKDSDVGKRIINTVELNEYFKTIYSSNSIDASVEANANINVVANSIPPLTGSTVELAHPIVLPDSSEIGAGTTIQIHKIYYVKKGKEARLTDFAGDNAVDCIKNVYHITTDNIDVTDQFKTVDGEDHTMLFTANDTMTRDYVVAYYAYDSSKNNDVWKVYAIKIVPMEDTIIGNTLTIGSKISLNYYVNFISQLDANKDIETKRYKSKDGVNGIDTANIASNDPDPKLYEMHFGKDDSAIAEYSKSMSSDGQKYYGYSYDGINAYEMSDMITGNLVLKSDPNTTICSKDFSVQAYAEKMIETGAETPLNTMLKDMLVYGAYAEKYAKKEGWKDITNTEYVNKYASELSDFVNSDNTPSSSYKNGDISFIEANLVMEKGMSMTMNIDFSDTPINSSYEMILYSPDGVNATYKGISKDSDGNITIPSTSFKTNDGGSKRLAINGLPPFYWNEMFKFYRSGNDSNYLSYSVASYCENQFSKASDSELLNLLKAMHKYGTSANSWYKSSKIK